MTRPGRPVDPSDDSPEWWRRTATLRRAPFVAIVIILVVLFKALQSHPSALSIRKSCTTPAFRLSTEKVVSHRIMKWAATGPAGMRYLLTIGVTALTQEGGKLTPQPQPGLTVGGTQAVGATQTMGRGCTDAGVFEVIVKPGRYDVRLFRLAGTGAGESAESTPPQTLTVTAK